jgi:hypothetical protein
MRYRYRNRHFKVLLKLMRILVDLLRDIEEVHADWSVTAGEGLPLGANLAAQTPVITDLGLALQEMVPRWRNLLAELEQIK